jgi:hypothetical protein
MARPRSRHRPASAGYAKGPAPSEHLAECSRTAAGGRGFGDRYNSVVIRFAWRLVRFSGYRGLLVSWRCRNAALLNSLAAPGGEDVRFATDSSLEGAVSSGNPSLSPNSIWGSVVRQWPKKAVTPVSYGQIPTHLNREFFGPLQGIESDHQGNFRPDRGIPLSSAICSGCAENQKTGRLANRAIKEINGLGCVSEIPAREKWRICLGFLARVGENN